MASIVRVSWIVFFITIVENFDTRRPMSTKLRYKYRVKDNSVLRKIIKLKDKQYFPCNYFKVVPIYVYFLISLVSTILLVIDLVTNNVITNHLPEFLPYVLSIAIFGLYFIYLLAIIVWWEIIDYSEMKFSKDERLKLKQLKKRNK